MDVREKLVELLLDVKEKCDNTNCGKCDYLGKAHCTNAWRADHLISHGVTAQEWISVNDRLPENDYGKHWKERKHYLVCLQNGMMRVARFGYEKNDWWIDSHDCVLHKDFYTEVTHWMETPQPPKGE